MATSKTAKITAEIEKTKMKISELQLRQTENSEIVDIVRGMSISLEELPVLLEKMRAGQIVPKKGEST